MSGRRSTAALLLFTLLLVRSRLLSLPEILLERLKSVTAKPQISQEDLLQVLQQIYVNRPDGSRTILVPHEDGISKVCVSQARIKAFWG